MDDLRPCPFCGGKRIEPFVQHEKFNTPVMMCVHCADCGATGPTSHEDYVSNIENVLAFAIERWNARINQSESQIPRWILTSEQIPPKDGKPFIAAWGNEYVPELLMWDCGTEQWCLTVWLPDGEQEKPIIRPEPTHWQPIPDPPE